MTTMSGTIYVDRRCLVKESPTLGLTDSVLLDNLCLAFESSTDRLALATEEIATPVHQLDSQACDSVVQAIVDCLRTHAYRELRSLTFVYSDGVVTLQGEVTTYYYKQLAQESVRRIAGVIKTINLVDVRYAELVVDLVKDPECKDL